MNKRNLIDRLRDPESSAHDIGISGVVWSLDDWDVLDDAANEISRLNSALHEAMFVLDEIVMAYELPCGETELAQAVKAAKELMRKYRTDGK
jgi:hypothetical protein